MLTDRPCFRPILGPSSHRGGFTRDMQRLAALVLALAVWFALPSPAHAQALPPPFAPQPLLRVFLDCNRCDFSYIRTEVTFIDYVRNREDGDVHVLVTTQRTGGGGEQWTLKYIGLGRRQGQDQTLLYNSPQTATDDEIRAGFVEIFKLGLVRYLTDLPVADRLRVTYKPVQGAKLKANADPWNFWVFRVGMSGDVNGEEQQSGRSIRGSFSANRTTDAWRVSISGNARYSDSTFLLEDEDGGREEFLSVSRNLDLSGIVVKSLTQHWSLGTMGNANSQTFRNYLLRTRLAGGIEYDYFPYSESTRRMLTLQYTVGHDYAHYREVTIFGKTEEQLIDHRAEVGLSLRQPWGTANASFNFSQYLTQPSKYSLGVEGFSEIRLFKGFSVNFFGEYSRTRDQIYLPRGEATTEEILLRQRQLFTGYQYFFNFGVSYSFGSILNNIVNPRFGGGGGF
jgi:hypothetical protein